MHVIGKGGFGKVSRWILLFNIRIQFHFPGLEGHS